VTIRVCVSCRKGSPPCCISRISHGIGFVQEDYVISMISSLAAMVRKVYLLCRKPRDVSRQQERLKLNNANVQQAQIRPARNSDGKTNSHSDTESDSNRGNGPS